MIMKLREGSFPVLVLSGLLLVLVVMLVVPPTGSYDTAPRLLVTLTSTIVSLSTSHPQSKYTISSQPRLRAHLCHSASEYLLVQLFSAVDISSHKHDRKTQQSETKCLAKFRYI